MRPITGLQPPADAALIGIGVRAVERAGCPRVLALPVVRHRMRALGSTRRALTAASLLTTLSCGDNALQNPAQPQMPVPGASAQAAGAKKKKLEAAGWRVGSAADFLGLTDDESAFVELKLVLSEELRGRRQDQGLTQIELAKRLGSSQSRVAKMEASDPSVSVDLLIRGLFATGASRAEIANAIGRPKRRRSRRATTRGNYG